MKRILALSLLTTAIYFSYGQNPCLSYFSINFDDTSCQYNLSIDTFSNANNIWQVGIPEKTVFDSAASFSNVIVTDTIHSYPINDTSSFIVKQYPEWPFPNTSKSINFSGNYYINSDSLKDYGKLEFSSDTGSTWIDILSDSPSLYIGWNNNLKPLLTGNSNGWASFFGWFHFEEPIEVLYRFTFISDSIPDSLDGLMFDNLYFGIGWEGIQEYNFQLINSNIYPNPVSEKLSLTFENPESTPFCLGVYDNLGRQVYTLDNLATNRVEIETKEIESGLYYYRLTNLKDKKIATGKFIIAR